MPSKKLWKSGRNSLPRIFERAFLSHACSAAPSPPAPVFDFRGHFCHSARMETRAFGFRLSAPTAISYQLIVSFPWRNGLVLGGS